MRVVALSLVLIGLSIVAFKEQFLSSAQQESQIETQNQQTPSAPQRELPPTVAVNPTPSAPQAASTSSVSINSTNSAPTQAPVQTKSSRPQISRPARVTANTFFAARQDPVPAQKQSFYDHTQKQEIYFLTRELGLSIEEAVLLKKITADQRKYLRTVVQKNRSNPELLRRTVAGVQQNNEEVLMQMLGPQRYEKYMAYQRMKYERARRYLSRTGS